MAWTEITRPKYQREGLRYASDTTEEEWAVIAPLLPPAHRRGRPRETSLRRVVEAIFYIAQSCCQWRMLPQDYLPFTTVQYYFYRWRDDGTWQHINHMLVRQACELAGRQASPTVEVIDYQSAKTPKRAARAVMTRVRRLMAASVICWSTPWGCSSPL